MDAFRIIAFDCLALWQTNESGARESDDPEFIHQLRVAPAPPALCAPAVRPGLAPGVCRALVPGPRDAADGLGAARDLDVMLAEVLGPVAESGLADEATSALIAMAVDRRDREKSPPANSSSPATAARCSPWPPI